MSDQLIETRGVEKATADVAALGNRAQRATRDVSYKVRTVFRKSEEQRFERTGPGWPRLAASTVERKARQGLDPRTLRATGDLYRSLTASRASNQIDARLPDEFRFGTTVPYAGYHDTGAGVPKRDLIDLSVKERRDIDKAIRDYIATGRT